MTFVYPYLLLAMLIPFVIFAFLITSNQPKLSRIFNAKVLKLLSASEGSLPVVVRNFMMLFALFFMIVAIGRPVMNKGEKKVEIQGLTLLTALDISGSMRSKDVYPNRLEFAKKKMTQFFDAMPSDQIGVVAFAYSSFVLAPFTSDKETLKMMVEGVDDSYINMGSTDFSALGKLISTILEEKKPKILVLFTDGGDKEDIAGFSDILKENHIDLYVVLVGTAKGAPVIDENGNSLKQKDGRLAITQRNDSLGEVAKESGGTFVIAKNGKEDIEKLADTIRTKYKNQQQGKVMVKERVEYFYYPLGLGLLFLLLSLSSLPRRSKD